MSLRELKSENSDIEKVRAWLAHIGETDERCIDEVLKQCAHDKEARAFFVGRYESDVKK